MNTNTVLRDLAETLGELHRFVRNEQAKDPKRSLLSPAADVRIAALIDEGLRQADESDACGPDVDFISVKVSKPQDGQVVEVLRRLDELVSSSGPSSACRYGVELSQFCEGKFQCDEVNGPGRLRDLLPSGRVTHWRVPDAPDEATQLASAMEATRIINRLEEE